VSANVTSVPPPPGLLEQNGAQSTACRLGNARHIEALTVDLASARYEVHAGVRVRDV
jgi:hypothetical protein